MGAVLGEQVEGIKLTESRGIKVAAIGFAVVQFDDDLFVSGGWGAEFQRENGPPGADLGPDEALRVLKAADLHIMNLYVMLSAKFLSTYCF